MGAPLARRPRRAPPPRRMGNLLLPLPVLAIVLAAADAALVRWGQPWREGGVELFFHAYFLWAAFGLLALAPARLTLRALDARSRPWPARASAVAIDVAREGS